MRIRRIHLFEFEDQSWFPSQFRSLITDLLQHQLTTFDVYLPIVPKIKEVMQKSNCHQIIDLCSGTTGPILQIQEVLISQEKYPVSVTLTDKYPNIEAFQKICGSSQHSIDFIPISVDATSVPANLTGFRTFFTSFHHFQPKDTKKILQDAVENNAAIGIFEFTERSFSNLIKVFLFAPLIVFLQTPFVKNFKWSRLFWTYIVPISPLVYSWDAMISHLRSYSPDELKQLTQEIEGRNYSWEIGKLKSKKSGFNITYLIGFPTES